MREQNINKIKKVLEVLVEEGTKIETQVVRKNNNIEMQAIIFSEPGKLCAPTIYIDPLLDGIEAGELTVENAASSIMDTYRNSKTSGIDESIMKNASKETILNNVEYKIVNKAMNYERLKDAPHKEILDLLAEYRFVLSRSEDGVASCIVCNNMMKEHNISIEELDKAAMKNTENNGFIVDRMSAVVKELTGIDEDYENGAHTYILTNKDGINGASIMLYPKYFKELSDTLEDDLYVLPSSIYEVIAIAVKETGNDTFGLKEMIKAVNTTTLLEHEILSYSLYKYNRKTGELEIV